MITGQASGQFEVQLVPLAADAGDVGISRMSIDKRFSGGLSASSQGQMLAVMTDVEGSAGYVAMERVTGTLDGREGSFALQHTGVMSRGAQQLTIAIVPDSGAGRLAGLAGTMTIAIVDGRHDYVLAYSLPDGS